MTCWTKLSCGGRAQALAGLDGEVVAVGRLIRAFRAEGRIREHHVVTLAAVRFVNGVAEINVRLDAVEEQIHQREPTRARHEVLADEGLRFDAPGVRAVEHAAGNFLGHEPFVAANKKAARAARRIANGEALLPARVGLHHADDGLDEGAGREVLARAFLAFAGGLFEQALERRALHVQVHRRPILLVNHGDDALEVDGIVKARRGLGENVCEQTAGFAEFAQDVGEKSPFGTTDNSPAIHRWVNGEQIRPSPAGAKEIIPNRAPHIPSRAFSRTLQSLP